MEKINTPLMAVIEEFERLKSKAEKLTDVIYLDGVIAVLQSILPDERDMIEKVHNDSIIEFIEALDMEATVEEHRAKDYFTQTFKGIEKDGQTNRRERRKQKQLK